MTVLIKGMEMPKNCGECRFCHTEKFTTWCCPTEREDIYYDAIPDWCPLEEPKTGKWIFNPKDAIELMFTKPKCSECGFESADGGNFCSNCGAKMEGGEEE